MKYFVFILFCFSIISCKTKQEKAEIKRPNFVFIFTDDHATQAITAYNDRFKEISPTPNIDKIASEGAILTNAFSTNAICGPSRASIITGKYSHINGYYKNFRGGHFDNSQWSFPKAFQQNGYTTALVGKWHLASEPKGFDYFKYHIDHGEQGVYWNPTYSENGIEVKEKGYATNITTDFALQWLDSKDKYKPFCLMLQYKAPHREWMPDSVYVDLFKGEVLPFPDTFNDKYEGKEQTLGNTHMTMDYLNRRDLKLTAPGDLDKKELQNWLDYGNNPGQIATPSDTLTGEALRRWKYQRYVKDYLATIRSVDNNIGRVLKYLKDNNLEDNTIVIYASDQGFFLGEHGLFDKRWMYEESLRMPFIIKYPGQIKPNTVVKDIVSNIDIAPTLLDLAGGDIPNEVQGKSFKCQLMDDNCNNWRQSMYYHYYEYPKWHHVQPHYGIRTDRYKLIHFYYDVDLWEFYDLQEDPEELNNLIASEAHVQLISKLKEELKSLKAYYGNTMSLDELRTITNTNFGGLESGNNNKH